MTSETNETHVITDLPSKKARLHIPFTKKNDSAPADTETTPKKSKVHGVYAFGALLLAGTVVAAAASKLRKSGDDEETDVPTDNSAA